MALSKGKSLNLWAYYESYREGIRWIAICLILSSTIQLVIPFLTQAVVDKGIAQRDIDLIYFILAAQMLLYISSISTKFIQNWIMVYVGIGISLDLSIKYINAVLRKPIEFYDTYKIGDLIERFSDNKRIEKLYVGSALLFIVAILNIAILSIVLIVYSWTIFLISIVSLGIMISWAAYFLNERRILDQEKFKASSEMGQKFYQIVNGVEEIKFHRLQKKELSDWSQRHKLVFDYRKKNLWLEQKQKSGVLFIGAAKNVLITLVAAKLVVAGQMTIGSMLAIYYLLGQLSQPIDHIVLFIQENQDAKLSFGRLLEIYNSKDEETGHTPWNSDLKDITFDNVSVSIGNTDILRDIDLHIPYGKYIAIVGETGSGKTTLLNTIIKFVNYKKGSVYIGSVSLENLDTNSWRDQISIVRQDGHLFSESILYNIALESDEKIDTIRMKKAIELSCIDDWINQLPEGMHTKVGRNNKRVSKGQKQRILIARAIYRAGDFLLLDEVTSALDNVTERHVINNLLEAFMGKTIIAIAHKLSTVKKADQILYVTNGRIAEKGNHDELMKLKGLYFKSIQSGK